MTTINNTKEARDKVTLGQYAEKLDTIVEDMRIHEKRLTGLREELSSFEANPLRHISDSFTQVVNNTIYRIALNEKLLTDLWEQYRALYHRPTWTPYIWSEYRKFLMEGKHHFHQTPIT